MKFPNFPVYTLKDLWYVIIAAFFLAGMLAMRLRD